MVADPKRPDFAAYRGATILTPNEHEVRLATRIDAEHDAEADRAGRAALDATGGEAVLVTRSARGLTLVRRGCPALHLPARAREVADVSGAGDTLVAALAVALGAGASLPDAAMLANLTAGISVGKQGTATVSRAGIARRAAPGRPGGDRPQGGDGGPSGGARRVLARATVCGSASPMAAST